MAMGIAWAVVGYVICALTNRGQLATTIVTAAAGALGLGSGMWNASGGGAAVGLGLLALEALGALTLVGVGIAQAMKFTRPGRAMFLAARRQAHDSTAPLPTHAGHMSGATGRKRKPKRRGYR